MFRGVAGAGDALAAGLNRYRQNRLEARQRAAGAAWQQDLLDGAATYGTEEPDLIWSLANATARNPEAVQPQDTAGMLMRLANPQTRQARERLAFDREQLAYSRGREQDRAAAAAQKAASAAAFQQDFLDGVDTYGADNEENLIWSLANAASRNPGVLQPDDTVSHLMQLAGPASRQKKYAAETDRMNAETNRKLAETREKGGARPVPVDDEIKLRTHLESLQQQIDSEQALVDDLTQPGTGLFGGETDPKSKTPAGAKRLAEAQRRLERLTQDRDALRARIQPQAAPAPAPAPVAPAAPAAVSVAAPTSGTITGIQQALSATNAAAIPLSESRAEAFYRQARGNTELARKMAREAGFTW